MEIKVDVKKPTKQQVTGFLTACLRITFDVITTIAEVETERQLRDARVREVEREHQFQSDVREVLGGAMQTLADMMPRESKFYEVDGRLRMMPVWAEIGNTKTWSGDESRQLFRIEDVAKRLGCELHLDDIEKGWYTQRNVRVNHNAVDAVLSNKSMTTTEVQINGVYYKFFAMRDDGKANELLQAIRRINR